MIADTSITDVPAEFVKMSLMMGAFLLANWAMLRRGQRASGNETEPVHLAAPVVTRQEAEHALKDEVEDELQRLENALAVVRQEMREGFERMMTAGQKRADTITARIDSEVRALRAESERQLEAIREKISLHTAGLASHRAEIENLKATDFRHDQNLQTLAAKAAGAKTAR